MAKKQTITSDLKQEPLNLDIIVDQEGTITDPNLGKSIQDLIGSQPYIDLPKTQFTSQEYLEQVAYYSEELLVSLEGIFIGGHAAQIKDQLYIALNNYKNI